MKLYDYYKWNEDLIFARNYSAVFDPKIKSRIKYVLCLLKYLGYDVTSDTLSEFVYTYDESEVSIEIKSRDEQGTIAVICDMIDLYTGKSKSYHIHKDFTDPGGYSIGPVWRKYIKVKLGWMVVRVNNLKERM